MSFVISEDAKDDIKDIYHYSFNSFGERRADAYHLGLHEKFEAICEGMAASTDYSYVSEGLRRANYISHSIYYFHNNDSVLVLRVLHKRSDPARHL